MKGSPDRLGGSAVSRNVDVQRAELGRAVGDIVETARDRFGLTQADIGLLVGTGQPNINMLAAGHRRLPGPTVRAGLAELARLLDAAPDPSVQAEVAVLLDRARRTGTAPLAGRSGPAAPRADATPAQRPEQAAGSGPPTLTPAVAALVVHRTLTGLVAPHQLAALAATVEPVSKPLAELVRAAARHPATEFAADPRVRALLPP